MTSPYKVLEVRVDCIPPAMLNPISHATVRYRLELTEGQLNYLHSLVSVDEAENSIEVMSTREYDNLVDQLEWHHKGIHGPSE